jgi:hypothetical protein
VALAGRFPDGINDLEVRRPSLEDIYLSMIEQSRPGQAELTEVGR